MNRKAIIVAVLLAILVIGLAYVILSSPQSTMLFVDPSTVRGTIGQDFTIKVSVSNVVNLYGWSFKLGWNSSLLDVKNVTEGPMMGNSSNSLFTYYLNTTDEHLVVDCTLLGNISGVNGTGTLTTIQFTVKENGACELNLYDTDLRDPNDNTIVHTVGTGQFSS